MASVCVGNQFTVVLGKLTVYRVQGTGYRASKTVRLGDYVGCEVLGVGF